MVHKSSVGWESSWTTKIVLVGEWVSSFGWDGGH